MGELGVGELLVGEPQVQELGVGGLWWVGLDGGTWCRGALGRGDLDGGTWCRGAWVEEL